MKSGRINVLYRQHFTMGGFKGETNATSERWCHTSLDSYLSSNTDRQDSLTFKELFILQLNNDKGKAELGRSLKTTVYLSVSLCVIKPFISDMRRLRLSMLNRLKLNITQLINDRVKGLLSEHPTCSKCSIKIYESKSILSPVVPSFSTLWYDWFLPTSHECYKRNNSDILSQ